MKMKTLLIQPKKYGFNDKKQSDNNIKQSDGALKKKSMELKAIKMEFIGNIVLLIRVPVNQQYIGMDRL